MPVIYLWGHDETTGAPVKCKVTAQGKLIIDASGFLENLPTEDQALKAPTSEWAYDHWKNVSAHHAATVAGDLDHQNLANRSTDDHHTKYTDVESRAAIGNLLDSTGKALKGLHMGWQYVSSLPAFLLHANQADAQEVSLAKSNNNARMVFTATEIGVGFVDCELTVYTGSAYTKIIRQDIFQAELDNYLETSPTEDSVNTAPTSEWAFDHNADTDKHHTKYTDLEAVWSFHSLKVTLTTGVYTNESMTGVHFLSLNTTGGDITLKGLDNGQIGHIIFCIKTSSSNDVHIIHASGDAATGDKIYTVSEGDESILVGSYGCFRLIHTGSMWLMDHQLP